MSKTSSTEKNEKRRRLVAQYAAKRARLKDIGSKARQQMEHLFGRKVFLETWVRVREGWSDDETALKAFGYE